MICSVMIDAAPAETDTPSTADADWEPIVYERQVAMLGRLAEGGLEIAVAIETRVKALASEADLADLQGGALAYDRVARAVRLTLRLQSEVMAKLKSLDSHDTFEAARARVRRQEQVDQQKARVERIVERIAVRQEAGDVERLVEDVAERLEHDDIYGCVLSRPTSELIAQICRDLGLSPDWPALAQEAWARDEAAGGDVGWPLAKPFGAGGFQRLNPEDHEDGHEGYEEVRVTFVPPS